MVHVRIRQSVAPSPFATSIVVKNETKRKLCYDHQYDQMEWLEAFTDTVIQNSVDTYYKQLIISIEYITTATAASNTTSLSLLPSLLSMYGPWSIIDAVLASQ